LRLEIAPDNAGLKSGLAEVTETRSASKKSSGKVLKALFQPQLTKQIEHPKVFILYNYTYV
jgi:hypothetical protein